MKKLVAACLPLVLIVVFMIVGVSVGESESLAGMVAGSHTATASTRQDDTCTIDTSISTVGTDELSRAEAIAKNLLANPYHIDMSGLGFEANKDTELVSAILGNMKYESGFIPAFYQATDGYAPDGTVLGKFPTVTGLNVKRGQHEDNQTMLDALDRDGVRGEGGRAIGLAQWDRGRSVDLIKFAMGRLNGSPFKDSPKQWDTPEVQAAFLLHEMVGSQKSFVDQIEGLKDFSGSDAHVRQLTEQWYRKFERGPLPEKADTAKERKRREDNIAARKKAAVDLHRHVLEWAQQVPGWAPSSSSGSGSCSSDSGSVEGGSLADFKYPNSPIPPATREVITNADHFSQYGWNPSGSFDAKLLSGSTGHWAYANYKPWSQCTLWTAVRLLSLGLSQKLVAKGIPVGELSKLGGGASQADSLGKFGVEVDNVPHVHDVVSFPPGVDQSDPVWGHVGVVEHVSDDRRTITISEGNSTGHVGDIDLRTIAVDSRLKFAHVEEFVKG